MLPGSSTQFKKPSFRIPIGFFLIHLRIVSIIGFDKREQQTFSQPSAKEVVISLYMFTIIAVVK